jgi:hypothetical protein
MPEMTTQKCRACIDTGTLGPEGECTDPAHQTTPDIAPPQATPPRTTVLSPDWTALGTRSNSSPMFLALRAEVESIIRESAHALNAGRAGGVAGTILATLAHRHGLRPGDAVTTEPDVDRARRALRAFIEHLDAAPSATVLDALNSARPPTCARRSIASASTSATLARPSAPSSSNTAPEAPTSSGRPSRPPTCGTPSPARQGWPSPNATMTDP